MRKIIPTRLIAAAAASVLLVAGCSGAPTESASPTSGSSSAPVTLTLWHSLGGVNAAAFDAMVASFNETVGAERGITVESVFQGDDTTEKLKTLDQANDLANFPDVGLIYGAGVPSVMRMEPFVPVQQFLDDDAPDSLTLDDLSPNGARAFSYQGKLLTMPFNISSILLYYNTAAFAEAGLDPDKPPATIDELAAAAKALTVREGNDVKRWGLNVELRRYHMANFIGGQGEYNFFGNNEGGRSNPMTEVTFGADGSMAAFLAEWQKVVDSGGLKHVEDNINEEFASGLSAMAIMSTARIATITDLATPEVTWKVAPLPRVRATDTGGTAVGGGSLGIFNLGDKARTDAAWEFVQYAASPEVQAQFHLDTGYIPVNKATLELPQIKEHLAANPAYQVAIDQMLASNPNVQEPFDVINWEVDSIIRDTLRAFAEGSVSAADAENQMVTQINERLAAYARANY